MPMFQAGSTGGATTGANTLTGQQALSANGVASTPPLVVSGAIFTGGTTTTTKPHVLIEPAGTVSTTWNTAGTGLGVNAPSGFTGNLLDLQVNGTTRLSIDTAGSIISAGNVGATTNFLIGTDAGRIRLGASLDANLTRRAAANWQLGLNDAAAPVAQTLTAQSVVAGTTNTAGPNFTVQAPVSTGSGISGDMIFQTGGIGAAATAQNAFATGLTIKGATQQAVFSPGSKTAPSITFAGNTSGIYSRAPSGYMAFTDGVREFFLSYAGYTLVSGQLGFGAINGDFSTTQADVFITRVGSNYLQIGNSDIGVPSAQTIKAQSVQAGNSNAVSPNFTLQGSASTGTAVSGDFIIQTGGIGAAATVQNVFASGLVVKGSTQQVIVPTNGAASTSPLLQSGTWFTGGTTTTTKPAHLIEPAGTVSTAWSVSGTGLGINAPAGFGGNLLDVQVNGGSKLNIGPTGAMTAGDNITSISSVQAAGNFNGFSNASKILLGGSNDTILSRRAAANWQFGSYDAAAPVAQTLTAQSVVAGTTNTTAPNFTVQAPASTGSGVSGDMIFQTGGTGAGATAQNAFATGLTIKGATQQVIVAGQLSLPVNGGSTSPAILFPNSGNSGIVGGGVFGGIFTTIGSGLWGMAVANGSTVFYNNPTLGISVNNGAPDIQLYRRAAANLQLGAVDAAAPIAQTLTAQSVVAGTTNTAGPNFTVQAPASTGSGVSGDMIFQTGGTGAGATAQNAFATAMTVKGATQQVIFASTIKTLSTTVSGLPSAATAGSGSRAFVTDATATTFLSIAAGAGANKVPVVSDGTNWLIG